MSNEPPTDPNERQRQASGQFVRTTESAERDAEAARLRSRGLTYRQIAAQLDIDVHTAHRSVKRAMDAIVAEPAADAVAFELERLDAELVRLDQLYVRVEEVLAREHITVSQGHVVEHNGLPVPDDDWILRAAAELRRIDESRRRNGESRRKLLGLDSPTKMAVSGGLTYEVVGVDPEALR